MGSCRCKMCGGQIHYDEGVSVAKCEFCGTEQTIVKTDDVKQLKLFSRANALRLQNEFDKAQTTYENILIDEPNNAEAHWGICLCRYGIEYVDDTKTHKKVPTCHRTVYRFIFDDLDYIEAINNADVVARRMYESEAKIIDKIQKNILTISQKEKPYDIFICYKETDEYGNRTKDSVVAQDIYDALIKKGYKVFFSRITLESKLGSNYEPVIFAALMSSKVMLAIGSKSEYFNSPWVKNEWGRFLSFMKDVSGKYLIPCYFDMDIYELPEEFAIFQAQDLRELGYMQDLIRGIDKIFEKKEPNQNAFVQKPQLRSNASKVERLINRAKTCLLESDFQRAGELVEDALNIDVSCAEAYIIKILIERRLKTVEELIESGNEIKNERKYIMAMKVVSKDDQERLTNINLEIKRKKLEIDKTNNLRRIKILVEQNNIMALEEEFPAFIDDYKDDDVVDDAKNSVYNEAIKQKNRENYTEALGLLKILGEYKESKQLEETCKEKQEYLNALNLFHQTERNIDALIDNCKKKSKIEKIDRNAFQTKIDLLKSLKQIEEANGKVDMYEIKLRELEKEIDILQKEREEKEKQELLEKEKKRIENRQKNIESRKKKKKVAIIVSIIAIAIVILTIVLIAVFASGSKKKSNNNSSSDQNGMVIQGKDLLYMQDKKAKSVTIPKGICTISADAFSGCSELEEVYIPSSCTYIGKRAFKGCKKLIKVELPSDFAYLGDDAFSGCSSLNEVIIPNYISFIGSNVFANCSHLFEIDYRGTRAQWNNTSKGTGWDSGSYILTIKCTDGTLHL